MFKELNTQEFKDKIFDYTKGKKWDWVPEFPSVLYFASMACGTCIMASREFTELKKKWGEEIQVYKILREDSPEIFALFGIKETPIQLVCTTDGKLKRAVGAIPAVELERLLELN